MLPKSTVKTLHLPNKEPPYGGSLVFRCATFWRCVQKVGSRPQSNTLTYALGLERKTQGRYHAAAYGYPFQRLPQKYHFPGTS